ncbi:MAG TPA: hypothetical protein VMV10_20210 [Pirellulales bacterium]|nr:hypothetical protein [Pirellulales bacterium]
MRKTFLGATIGAVAGGAAGAMFATVSLLVDSSITADAKWLLGLSAGIGAYAGLLIGSLSAGAAAASGRTRHAVAVISLGLAAAALSAQFVFGLRRPVVLLLCATAGALAAARSFRRLRPATAAAPRQRWFQFNLGMLLAIVFVVSAALATYVSGPLEQQRIAARVVASGGEVRYEARAPAWMTELLGDWSRHWFDRVTELQIRDAVNADIPQLSRLPHLRRLALGGKGLTDEGLSCLTSLRRLESLSLFGLPAISDAGLKFLPELESVDDLWLADLEIGDAGFQHVKRMPRLRQLSLYKLPITDAGLTAIEDLRTLEVLSLHDLPELTDDGFESLGRLTGLKELDVLKCNIVTDAGLVHLKSLDKLEKLRLSTAGVTGACFQELESLTALRWLAVRSIGLTDDGLKAIARLDRLKWLEIDDSSITDNGLANVENLKDLEFLSFTNTAITDAGLEHLRSLKHLKGYLYAGSKVTEEGVSRLRNEMQLGQSR